MNKYKLFFFVAHVIFNENDFVGVIFFFFKLLVCYGSVSVLSVLISVVG